MTQWILTSSILILAVLMIRALAKDKLSARVRYALWGLVLLRLLIPGSVGQSAWSVLNVVPKDTAQQTQFELFTENRQHHMVQKSELPVVPDITDTSHASIQSDTLQTIQTGEETQRSESTVQYETTRQTERNTPKNTSPILLVWAIGMAVMAGVFTLSNLRFFLKLRRSRCLVQAEAPPVYVTSAIETPCLIGFPHPAVYVTPDVLADETALRHVLAHELTHYRHKDHVWSVLRCVCVTLHWYNPLVWAAAFVSQQDAELACDEGAVRCIGEMERTNYARTLLNLSCGGYKGMLTMATSMTGNETTIKTRILRIVKNPQMPKIAIPVILTLALVIGLVAFTGEKTDPLEGVWVAEYEETAKDTFMHPDFARKIRLEMEIKDGLIREYRYCDGTFDYGNEYSYRCEGNVIFRGSTRYDHWIDEYTYELLDDTLKLYKENGLLYGEFVRYARPENVFLTDEIEHVTSVELLRGGESVACVQSASYFYNIRLLGILQGCEILESHAVPAIPHTEHVYTVLIESPKESKLLQIADGVIYMNGVAYETNKKAALRELFLGMDWEPVGGYVDEIGQRYSEFPSYSDEIYLHLDLARGYGISRYYTPENQTEWEAAIAELIENKALAVGDESHLQQEGVYSLIIENVQQLSGSIQVQSNGFVLLWDSYETGEYTEYYAYGDDVSKLMALAAPYFAIAEQNFEEAKQDVNCDGTWVMNQPHGEVKYIRMTLDGNAKYAALSASMGSFSAQVGERVITSRFDYYVRDGLFHVRRKDLTEEVFPCIVEENKLTITAHGTDWVFEPMTEENKPQIRRDIFRSDNCAVELSEETVAKLETLLRDGIGETVSNIIYKKEYFYCIPALHEAFDSELLVLSDYGTFHYGNQAYKLTNWEEVKAFLDTIYTVDYYTVKY